MTHEPSLSRRGRACRPARGGDTPPGQVGSTLSEYVIRSICVARDGSGATRQL